MSATATVQEKTVTEFGQRVTLYRIVEASGKGTLWHRDLDKAWEHFARLRRVGVVT